MTLAELTQTHGWKNFMAKLYGIGASVVIVGALFKIMHWPGAGAMLTIGLSTEAVIFLFSAFEPLHEELDWTLVYPQLAGLSEDDEIDVPDETTKKVVKSTTGGDALVKFDEMLEKAGGGDLFSKLGDGLTNLNERVSDMANISDAAIATNDFTANMKNASETVNNFTESYKQSTEEVNNSVNGLSDAYKQSAESLNYSVDNLSDNFQKVAQTVTNGNTEFSAAYQKLANSMDVDFNVLKDGNSEYSEKMSSLNKNLSALNAIFELQLNEADIDKMMEDLNGSVDESRKYHQEISKLGKRLEALNNVYGNMLTAMNVQLDD